jgi:hypothetical protein
MATITQTNSPQAVDSAIDILIRCERRYSTSSSFRYGSL